MNLETIMTFHSNGKQYLFSGMRVENCPSFRILLKILLVVVRRIINFPKEGSRTYKEL